MQSILVFYRDLHPKAAGLLRESTLPPGAVYIDGLGIQERMEPCLIHRANGTDGYLLMGFNDPVVIHDKTGANWHPPGSLILWHPEEMHYYGNENQAWNHSWIHLCGEDVPALLKRTPIPRNQVFPFSLPELLDKGLLDIYEELEGTWPADALLIRNLVENLFRRVRRVLFDDPPKTPVPERMRAVKRYLDTHYNQVFTLEELAQVGRLSVSHLCAVFRECFGCPPIEYRTRLRMEHASRFLRDTSLRVSEIASLVGYGDIYYFSKHFKAYHGASPREYRLQAARPAADSRN
ncbi:MAG: helix-turn-helix transcriptional regulator [Pirellulales bacterium]|nr:helix-turn-helix transcriptional regulator [Pirellulales bacterium]